MCLLSQCRMPCWPAFVLRPGASVCCLSSAFRSSRLPWRRRPRQNSSRSGCRPRDRQRRPAWPSPIGWMARSSSPGAPSWPAVPFGGWPAVLVAPAFRSCRAQSRIVLRPRSSLIMLWWAAILSPSSLAFLRLARSSTCQWRIPIARPTRRQHVDSWAASPAGARRCRSMDRWAIPPRWTVALSMDAAAVFRRLAGIHGGPLIILRP